MGEKRQGLAVWVWVLIGLLLSGIVPIVVGVLAFSILIRRVEATDAEVGRALTTWSAGLVHCGEGAHGLPPSSSPVPATLEAISGKKYQSVAGDWSEPAHTCAGFTLGEPQAFQYAWSLRSAEEGVLKAVGADSNGKVDAALEVKISCQGGRCTSNVANITDAVANRERAYKREMHDLLVDWFGTSGPSARSGTHALGSLAVFVGFIWLMAAAFSVSIGWGFATAVVPCFGPLTFTFWNWDEAKRPFLCWSLGWVVSGMAAWASPTPVKADSPPTAANEASPAHATTDPKRAANRSGPAQPPPPVPTAAPIRALDGAPVDLSTLMGRARKLADAWQPEAALVGIEATLIDGFVQPETGGTVKITFGPSPFAATETRGGMFLVTYGKLGIASGPAKSTAGKAIAEPMCAPEGLLPALGTLKGSPYSLRYALGPDQRPAWLVTTPSQPKQARAFDPQDCRERGSTRR